MNGYLIYWGLIIGPSPNSSFICFKTDLVKEFCPCFGKFRCSTSTFLFLNRTQYIQCIPSRHAKNSVGPYLVSRACIRNVLFGPHKLLVFVRRQFKNKLLIFFAYIYDINHTNVISLSNVHTQRKSKNYPWIGDAQISKV